MIGEGKSFFLVNSEGSCSAACRVCLMEGTEAHIRLHVEQHRKEGFANEQKRKRSPSPKEKASSKKSKKRKIRKKEKVISTKRKRNRAGPVWAEARGLHDCWCWI